jgi:chitinase
MLPALLAMGILAAAETSAGLWCTAYYAAWMQGTMPASQVDYSAITHVIHFAVVPKSDGTLDSETNGVTPANSSDVVTRAHAAGTKVLISVGGAGSAGGFRGATAPANLTAFINQIVAFARNRGYDGIDLDWEPLEAGDATPFTNLVNGLRTALDAQSPGSLLTAAAATQPALFAALQNQFNQINLMTYDLAGPWPGWVTWFNSPVYDGGYRFPSTGSLVPSADTLIDRFVTAGVLPRKLASGIDFYGRVWSGGEGTSTGGASLPRQTWTTAPGMTYETHAAIMTKYHQAQRYSWDEAAQAAYLSINETGAANDKFITYDDERTCRVKAWHAAGRGLGGVMIWELGGGYRASQPAGQRDPLLQAVKQAVRGMFRITRLQSSGTDVTIEFSSTVGQSYTVEGTSDLGTGTWQTIASLTATEPVSLVTDPGAASQPRRFYRVRESRSVMPEP